MLRSGHRSRRLSATERTAIEERARQQEAEYDQRRRQAEAIPVTPPEEVVRRQQAMKDRRAQQVAAQDELNAQLRAAHDAQVRQAAAQEHAHRRQDAPEAQRRREPQAQQAPRREGAAVFRRSSFTRHRTNTQRAGAIILWLTSVAGALLWGGGGWEAWSSLTPNVLLAGFALVLQGVVSWSQVVSSDRPFGAQYLSSLAISVGTSLAGYLPLLGFWLGQAFGIALWTPLWWFATAVTMLLAIAADVVPERTLFEG